MNRKMKDSGVEWIGEIPKDWEVTKIKNVYNIKAGGDLNKDVFSDIPTKIHKYPIYTNKQNKEDVYGYTSKANYHGNSITVTARGDIGIAFYRENSYDAIIRLLVLTPKKNQVCRYHKYFINEVLNFNEGKSAIKQLSTDQLSPHKVCSPSIKEQKSISNFLDKKTLEIDNIIFKTRKVIEEYKKYKQSLITETITKGLDKNAPMKNSGIEWIGEIPENWELIKLKYLVACNQTTLDNGTSDDYVFRYVDIGSVDLHKGITEYEDMKYKDSPSRARRIVKKGDLIVSTVRTYLRAIATIIDDEDVIVSTGFAVLTPRNINEKYLEYITKTEHFISGVIRKSVGVSYPAINSKDLLEIKILNPQLKGQQQIANYLDKKCNQIDNIISTKEKLLTEMESYKKSLIYETVTGKREVD